jgi:hypothetical protein
VIPAVPVLDLYIARVTNGFYEVRIEYMESDLMMHQSITDALVHCAENIPSDFTHFVNVHYGGVCSGTIAVATLKRDAQSVASSLVSTCAAVGHSMGQM